MLSRFVLVLSRIAVVLSLVCRVVLVFSRVVLCCVVLYSCCLVLSRVVSCCYSCSFLDLIHAKYLAKRVEGIPFLLNLLLAYSEIIGCDKTKEK